MKTYLFPIYLTVLSILFSMLSHQAFAHFPATDNSMTVELHVDPDDNPTPGQQAYLYFLFDDATKRFQLSQCNCVVSISEQGRQIYRQKLTEKKDTRPSIWGASLPYVFPQQDVYHIQVTGGPTVQNTFKPFDISWDFRVDPDGSPGIVKGGPSDIQILLGTAIGGVIFLGLFGWFIKKQIIDSEDVDNTKSNHYNKKRS